MRKTLQWIKDHFGDPEIIITENGFSDMAGNVDDMMRVYYYKHNLNNMLKGSMTSLLNSSTLVLLCTGKTPFTLAT